MKKYATLDLEILQITDEAAWLTDGVTRAWVQKRLIPNWDWGWELGPQTVEADIPEWLAQKVGWI